MISNIYFWIFPAAFFTAAGLGNLTVNLKRKRNIQRARRNRIVWFFINISIAIAFLGVSVFFVDWSQVEWSRWHLFYGFVFFVIFYFSIRLKFVIGIPIVLILSAFWLFFNVSLQSWIPVAEGNKIGTFRILHTDTRGIRVEYENTASKVFFVEEKEAPLSLGFEFLKVHSTLFFTDSEKYYRLAGDQRFPFPGGLSGSIFNWIIENTFLLNREFYTIDIADQPILMKHDLLLDLDHKNIIIGN